MRNLRWLAILAIFASVTVSARAGEVLRGSQTGLAAPTAAAPQGLPTLPGSPVVSLPPTPAAIDATISATPEAAGGVTAQTELESQPAAAAAPAALRQEKPVVAQRFDELQQAFGERADGAVAAAPTPAAASSALSPAERTKPITITDAHGLVRQLSYDPAVPAEPLYKAAWRWVRGIHERVRRVRRFRRRIKDLVAAVTDDNLWWSLNRLKALELQEGILRLENRTLINEWPHAGQATKRVSAADFAESSIEPESLMKLFKGSMDLEEPTLQYQYAFAQNLHNRLHRMAHFLGTTLQEHIIAVALKGKPNQRAIWASEELRHGPILERVYNASRGALPPLTQQGEAPRLPRNDARYLALSGMANRSLAELFAASAYLVLRANAKADSGVDMALDGLYRDEVYHYIIMATVNRFVFGQGRWQRLYRIIRHDLDYNPGSPDDKVIHRRRFMSPLAYLETAYAILSIDKRIDTFIKTQLNAEKARDLVGPTYVTDAELEASIARGEQTRTKFFRMEQNPHLSEDDVKLLGKRMPKGWIDPAERKISASDVHEVLDTYRQTLLRNPDYWMRRKGFVLHSRTPGMGPVLERKLEKDPSRSIVLLFPGAGKPPVVRVGGRFTANLDDLSMRQIGALMDAEDMGVIDQLAKLKGDLTPQQIMNLVGRSPAYQRQPIPVK